MGSTSAISATPRHMPQAGDLPPTAWFAEMVKNDVVLSTVVFSLKLEGLG